MDEQVTLIQKLNNFSQFYTFLLKTELGSHVSSLINEKDAQSLPTLTFLSVKVTLLFLLWRVSCFVFRRGQQKKLKLYGYSSLLEVVTDLQLIFKEIDQQPRVELETVFMISLMKKRINFELNQLNGDKTEKKYLK